MVGALLPASAELTHRYNFDADANDSVGSAHGTAFGEYYFEGGTIQLVASGSGYVALPSGLIQGYEQVTIETWVLMYDGPNNWQRIYDFGGVNDGGLGRNYIFLTGQSGAGDTRLVISDADPGYNGEDIINAGGTLDDGTLKHVVGVLSPLSGYGALYIDGQLVASRTDLTRTLATVDPDNCWIGRSLYSADAYLDADIYEFRIHNTALTAAQVAASYAGGADNPTTDPGTANSLVVTADTLIPAGGVTVPEVTVTFSFAGVVVLGPNEATLTSANPSIVQVQANGSLMGMSPGTTTVTAEYGGASNSVSITVEPGEPAALAHRYSFSETTGASTVVDSVGGANGTVYAGNAGTVVSFADGQVVFPGSAAGYTDGPYIDLPDGIVSSKNNIAFEVWATWNGPAGESWQRLFDIGSSGKAGGDPHAAGNGTGSFFLTPRSGGNRLRFNAAPQGFANEQQLESTAPTPTGQQLHIVALYAPDFNTSQLWLNGILQSSRTAPFPLSDVHDTNCWIGLANWNDPPLQGSINEFRIYEGFLTELDIALRAEAGPDALPTEPGALQSISLDAPALFVGNPVSAQAALLAEYENISGLNVSGLSASTFTSSDEGIFTVTDAGLMMPIAPGSATLEANYGGLTTTTTVEVLAPTALEITAATPLNAGGPVSAITVTATYPGDLTANVTGFNGVNYNSSSASVAAVTAAGVRPIKVGSTTVSASYSGQSAQVAVQVQLPPGHTPATLIHRYSFSEAAGSTTVSDSVGSANGTLYNPRAGANDFNGTGRLLLAGSAWNEAIEPGGFVDLPNGLVSSLTSLTIEAWVNWAGGPVWQRIFDFGRNAALNEREFTNPGQSYMFLTPSNGGNMRFGIKEGEGAELPQLNGSPMPSGEDVHVCLVYDTAAGAVRLYLNGAHVDTEPQTLALSVLEDRDVYLGRSQWTDSFFAGQFDEFRIWRGTMLETEVRAAYLAGPDELPGPVVEEPLVSAVLTAEGLEISWPAGVTGFVLKSSSDLTAAPGAWSEVSGVDQNRVVVPTGDTAEYYRLEQQ